MSIIGKMLDAMSADNSQKKRLFLLLLICSFGALYSAAYFLRIMLTYGLFHAIEEVSAAGFFAGIALLLVNQAVRRSEKRRAERSERKRAIKTTIEKLHPKTSQIVLEYLDASQRSRLASYAIFSIIGLTLAGSAMLMIFAQSIINGDLAAQYTSSGTLSSAEALQGTIDKFCRKDLESKFVDPAKIANDIAKTPGLTLKDIEMLDTTIKANLDRLNSIKTCDDTFRPEMLGILTQHKAELQARLEADKDRFSSFSLMARAMLLRISFASVTVFLVWIYYQAYKHSVNVANMLLARAAAIALENIEPEGLAGRAGILSVENMKLGRDPRDPISHLLSFWKGLWEQREQRRELKKE